MSARLGHGRKAILGVSLAALLAACGGSTSGTASPPATPRPGSASLAASTDAPAQASSTDTSAACAVVTAAAVSQAAGFSVARSSGAGQICMYQNADSSKYLAVQLYGSQADMALMLQIEPGSEHVAGLGDDAFWVAQEGLLFVRKGDHGAEFLDPDLGGSPTDTSPRDALVTLARSMVGFP